ncbi:MAG: hypothetical protein ACT4NY_09875 [Pseudonocardiales bacterium]
MNGEREPNVRLRRARTARRQTQQQVAEAIGERLGHPVDVEYIGRLERGVITWPNADYRAAFRAHFGVASDGQLGFYCSRSRPDPHREDDEVRRRTVLTGLPVAGLAASWPLAALVEAAAAEDPVVPRRVGAEEVEQVRALAGEAYDLHQEFSGGVVLGMLGAQLRWAVALLDAHVDPDARDALHSAVGHLARWPAAVAHDVGVDSVVPRYLQVALLCADEAGDWSLRAKSLADWARNVEYSGNGEMALTLAQQALVRLDRLTPLERIWPCATEAAAYGRNGDAEACRAALGRMEDHFLTANPADESPAMVAHYSPAELAFATGNALWPLALRGYAVADTATQLRTAADTFEPGRVRYRTYALTRLATLQFTHGDPDEAVAVANTALDLAGTAQSRRLTDELTTLRHAASRHQSLTGVTDLGHRLDQALVSA